MAEEQLLLPTAQYLKSGIHIGTKFKTKYMHNFIYKTRHDGLSVLNLKKIDERIKIAADMLSKFNPEDILIVCRRENGWNAIKLMHEITNFKIIPGRYPPGMMTNIDLDDYYEPKVVLVVDAWPDRNAVNDAFERGIPIIALSDTNNQSNKIDLVVPCNNKGKKSLGTVFYLITREYMKNRGLIKGDEDMKFSLEKFIEE